MTLNPKSALRAAAVALLAGVPLLAAPGCRDNDAPITGRADRFDPPWLLLGSSGLRADTVVGEARPVRDAATGILSVAVPVRNVTDLELHITYVYRFLDDRGVEVNRYPGVMNIPARQSRDAVGTASGPNATQFKLELNYPRVN